MLPGGWLRLRAGFGLPFARHAAQGPGMLLREPRSAHSGRLCGRSVVFRDRQTGTQGREAQRQRLSASRSGLELNMRSVMEHPTVVLGIEMMDHDHLRIERLFELASHAADEDL